MKRKYLSALLMGTLTVASMSTFTSCKDYDDDISNLQGQIDKLATADQLSQKVAELQALISSNTSSIGTLQSALDEAKKAAEKAQTTADSKATLDQVNGILADYAKVSYVDDAKKSLNDAIEALKTGDIAQLKKDVEAAAKAAAAAKADAEAAIEEVKKDLTNKFEAKLETEKKLREAAIAVLETNKADKAALDAAIEKLEEADRDAKVEILGKLEKYITSADAQTKINEAIDALKKGDIKDINTKLDAVKTTAENALAKADKAESEQGKAYVKALEAADAATAAATAAAHAQEKADANETAVNNINDLLGTGFSATNTVKAAIELINTQLTNDKTGLAALAGRLSSIESLLNQDTPDATSLKTRVDNIENKLKDIIGQYSTMVTDVQLYNFAGYNGNPSVVPGWNTTLQFVQAAEKANVFPAQAGVATEQLKFEEGKYYAGDDSLLIRVSPVDAELTTSNVSLMNSQGKELDDIIDVTDVHRFKGLLTRASSANTGLWVVKFKATDLGDKFKEAAEAEVNGSAKKVLYAVAVKNTYNTTDKAEDAKTRRVTSEFGVDLKTSDADYAWDFEVNGKSIENIHNRYVKTDSYEYTDSSYYAKTYVEELVWNGDPATTVIKENADANKINAVDRKYHTYKKVGDTKLGNWYNGIDNRQSKAILAVEKGKPITIDFSNTELKGVKGFYVTLDEKFAKESAPSELNAWNSYEYENVGYKGKPAKLFEGSTGTITIKDMNNVQGDIIGFRVYAVNYDGTLYDPDGRAFYVAVGDVKKELSLGNSKLTVNASNKFESTVVLPADFSKYDFNGNTGWKVTEEDASGSKPTFGNYGDFTVKYLNDKGEEIDLNKNVRSIKFILNNPQAFIDGATYNVSITLTNTISSATANVCTVNASFTKVMPNDAPAFCYRDGFTKNPEYIIPDDNNYVVTPSKNKGGSFDFRNILIINNNKEWKGVDLMDEIANGLFKFNVANGTYDNKKLAKAETQDVNYILNVNNNGETNLVDNKTERTIAANYIYRNISKYYDAETNSYKTGDYPVASNSTEKIVYCSWMKTFSYDVVSNVKNKVEQNTWLKHATVEWKQTPDKDDNNEVKGSSLDLDNLTTAIKDVKLLPVGFPKGVSKTKFGEFLTTNVLAIVPDKDYGEIYTTDKAGNQINPYFSASIKGATITLKQISQTAIPSSVKEGKIHFTVKDCFGNTMPVVLPFTITVEGVAAKKH